MSEQIISVGVVLDSFGSGVFAYSPTQATRLDLIRVNARDGAIAIVELELYGRFFPRTRDLPVIDPGSCLRIRVTGPPNSPAVALLSIEQLDA